MAPKISVIMSIYNAEAYLSEAIESILNQTFDDFEFIIINDGSTDSSPILIKKYANQDKRIILIDQDNMGLTKSLNKGISISQGEYIARQDSDDISDINRLKIQFNYIKDTDISACYSRSFFPEKNILSPRISFYLPVFVVALFKNPFVHGTLLIKKKVLERVGLYDETFYYAQDYKLLIELLKMQCKIICLPNKLYISRAPEGSIGKSRLCDQSAFAKKIKAEWMRFLTKKILTCKIKK